jgi:hypothetical protein
MDTVMTTIRNLGLAIAAVLIILLGMRVAALDERLTDLRRRSSMPHPGYFVPTFSTHNVADTPVTIGAMEQPGRQIICDEAEDALYGLAACLREELRGTDLAMRQGADRFLVLLADTDAAGAAAVMRRLEGSVEGIAQLRAGIAVYGSEHDTAERLAAAAAAALTRATDG